MRYEEAERYIESIPKFTKKHTSEHTQEFLRRLGNPCCDRKIIHVAGTNGKGSVCAFMQAVLLSEGKHVGFFTSPHLVKLNERIQVDGRQITDEGFLRIFEKVKLVVDQMCEEGIEHPSYFEFLYGMGMTAFAETEVGYVILETGLGGRLDATNSFERPYLTVITSISLDHTEILGDTIEKIAAEKAGIIKPGIPVFYDGSCEKAGVVIRRKAQEQGAPCRKVGNDAFEIREITDKHIAFSMMNEYDKHTVWQVRGSGLYQVMNAALAIRAMQYIFGTGGDVRKWQASLSEVCWPGRMEEIAPGVIIDGAHNLAAISRFVESIRAQEENRVRTGEEKVPLIILFSAVADKDYRHMIEELCEGVPADAYVITRLEDARGADTEELSGVFRECTEQPVYAEQELGSAYAKAMEMKGSEGRLYCLGSLYLAGELKKLTGGRKDA